MTKANTTITKNRELMIENLDLKRRKWASQVMDKIRRKHRIKIGEKNSTEIVRHFRETRYNQ